LNFTDLKIYIAILELLKGGENVTVKAISDKTKLHRTSIYYRLNNLYLFKNKLKQKERKWQKKK